MAFTDGNIVIGTSVDVGGINTGLRKIEKSFNKLSGLVALSGLGLGFAKLGKAALNAASDLQEVQNVVDVSFTKLDDAGNVISDMTYKIEGFAQTCIEKFGMSEFAAKQTAGSFMAMGKSMGLSMEEASDMAVKLTGLTGDFSSFYNISQDYARVALSAVYTGETETLKRYGIMLTEANLQQYAMTQGIETSVKKMGARDKALLRYNYILQATKDMEGDFVRTQDSWANSTRVLSQLWNQFLIVLGSGLISVLSPLVQVLGQIVQRLIQFTQALWQALSNIFGFQLQDITKQAKGAASGIGDMSDSVDDLGNSIDKAGKKAKKNLAKFDELNNTITPDSASSGAGGAGIALDNLDFDPSGLWDPKKKDSPWSDIDNLYDLGKWIGQKLCDMMESIDWDKVYQKARGFGVGLATFLNGLISTDLFKDLGHTIAGALNTIIYEAVAFAATFDWTQFGEKLAAGINEFFATFDFAALADAINKWVQGLWRSLKTFITNINWTGEDGVFAGVKKFFKNLDPETVAILFGFIVLKKLLSKSLKKIIIEGFTTGLMEGLGAKSLSSVITNLVGQLGLSFGIGLSNIGSTISFALRYAFTTAVGFVTQTIPSLFMGLISKIGLFFTTTIPTLASSIAGGFSVLFHNLGLGESLNTAMTYAFGGVATTIAGIVSIVSGAVIAVKNFFDMWNNGWSILKTIFEAMGLALAALGAVILGAPALVAGIVAGIIFAISQLAIVVHDNWEAIKSWFAGVGEWFKVNVIDPVVAWFGNVGAWVEDHIITPVRTKLESIKQIVSNVIEAVASFVSGLFKRIGQFAEGCWIIIKAVWIVTAAWFKSKVIEPITNFFRSLWESVKTFFQNLWNDIKIVWSVVSTWFKTNVIDPTVNFFKQLWIDVKNFFKKLWEDIKLIWNVVANWFNNNVIQPIINFFRPIVETISGFFTRLWEDIKFVWNTVSDWFKTNVIDPVVEAWNIAINSIKEFFEGLWTSIKDGVKGAMNAMIGAIESAINGIIDKINTIVSGFNKIVGWAANITGDSWGGVDLIPNVNIPRLATGTVVPPNNPFMAMLGDNKRETEIVSPLSTMKQALLEALQESGIGGTSGDIIIKIDGREVFKAVKKENDNYIRRTGSSAFLY